MDIKQEQSKEYMEEAKLSYEAAQTVFNSAESENKNLWAQVVKSCYDSMEQALSAVLAKEEQIIPTQHPQKVFKFINICKVNKEIEDILMRWLGKRSSSQYVDIKFGELSVPHKIFKKEDAEKALKETQTIIKYIQDILGNEEEMKKEEIIVTSALPYANGPIHIGHLVEYIQTDIFVRFLKLTGENVVYCCADDTHGTPIQISAEKAGILPEELISNYHKEHLADFTKFNIKFDSYYSTNSEENKYFADLIYSRLKKKGLIYQKEVELAYCNKCKRFLPDRYIKGKCPKCNAPDQYGDVCENCNAAYTTTDLVDPYCAVCGETPTTKKSTHYFFKLSNFAEKLKKWFESNKSLQPEIVHYLENWIKDGLQDWDISRDGPYFGFKIPGEENLYYYVWLDAPIGYISSFSNTLDGDTKKAEQLWNKSRIIHFIGKDIIYFHFLFWPAMLDGADLQLPENIFVHGFLTVNGEKMSKSRGTFFTAAEFAEKYKPECLRFYYAKVLSKKLADIDLNFREFTDSANNELVANLANFCYRVLSFTNKFFNSEVKDIDNNKELIESINKKIKNIEKSYSDVNFNEALKEILSISDLGNQYFQKNEPWKLVKEDKEKAHEVIGTCVNLAKILSVLISPILPSFSEQLHTQLGLKEPEWKELKFDYKNRKISKAEILLQKFEEKAEELFPADLRVGKITKVQDHPEADKLYILEVDFEHSRRQLVAGLKEHYNKEELLNKNIIVVYNLKPTKLRGIESQGMLLAGEQGKEVGILTTGSSKPGDKVTAGNLKSNDKQINFEEFSKIKLKVSDGKVLYKNKILKTGKEEIKVEKIKEGEVR